eukprot:Plantae.Rhodophyta-Purpureofilum_apyrenoidigerum.ctg3379.p2 GENE.Plantae.Rhodophyta-Purpureofilum_apyrenoidigerum.ctg3379~~Plantae.Rhodophyta-Purpureofilum_apyrenoidigerum.ctg3379.p2  ORF type:complete len:204 (+),score=40.24 Plantae.Rhodophyta-Purpureofilum_apyrenoidigerum.ctg3379:80-691(+)
MVEATDLEKSPAKAAALQGAENQEPMNPYLSEEKFPYQCFFATMLRTGELTPYAHKMLAHLVILFASITIWGDSANYTKTVGTPCQGKCGTAVTFSVFLTAFAGAFILLNLLIRIGIVSRYVVPHFVEFLAMGIYLIPIFIVVIFTSLSTTPISNTGLAMAWVCFFALFYGLFEAYHTFREDNQPTAVEELGGMLEEDNFIYG